MSQSLKFTQRILIVGFGSIGQGTLPLLLRHIDVDASQITILTPDDRSKEAYTASTEYGVNVLINKLSPDNYDEVLQELLSSGDFLINVSVDVCSWDVMRWCQLRKVLYIDTVVEPWPGGYDDPSLSVSARSNYHHRENILQLKREFPEGCTTSISCHGANPGLVSHFVKQALVNIAKDTGEDFEVPKTKKAWAQLAEKLGIRSIHISERDTQVADRRKARGEFVNTWSVEGLLSEGRQPAELGWGTHEKTLPHDAQEHDHGCGAAIYLNRCSASTKVRSWAPNAGPFVGFLITHNEAISIADYFTVKDGDEVQYRPTVHYAYHPSDDTVLSLHEMAGTDFEGAFVPRLIIDEIVEGIDELGVLLMGHKKTSYWYGSQLDVKTARKLAPHNNATSLQVTSAVLAGVMWAIRNPTSGIVESDDLPFDEILKITSPYIQPVVGHYSDWTPLASRQKLFPEEHLDRSDPFQFSNFRVF